MPKFSVIRDDATFVDGYGVTIHYHAWRAAKPVGIVQIAHGLGEYAGRYERVAQELVSAGYSVYADDHRGHGLTGLQQSGGDHTKLGRLGAGGLRAAVEAIHQFTGIVRAENPGIPLTIMGQSWGSLMVQMLLNSHAGDYDAAILAGTAHRLPGRMNAGKLNAAHKHLGSTGYEWLSRDPLVSQAFLDDPLTFYADALRLFGPLDGLRLFGIPTKTIEKDIPLLIIIGSEDSLGGEKSAHSLATAYLARSRLTDVKLTVYSKARHDLFNETNRDEVVTDLVEWMRGRLSAERHAPGIPHPAA